MQVGIVRSILRNDSESSDHRLKNNFILFQEQSPVAKSVGSRRLPNSSHSCSLLACRHIPSNHRQTASYELRKYSGVFKETTQNILTVVKQSGNSSSIPQASVTEPSISLSLSRWTDTILYLFSKKIPQLQISDQATLSRVPRKMRQVKKSSCS